MKHGLTYSPTWKSWMSMRHRCHVKTSNKKNRARYYDRGILVCERWRYSFSNFLSDMGERPQGKTLDRIDNDGNYEPSNCRWATSSEQARNMAKSRNIELDGVTKNIADWAQIYGIGVSTIRERLKRGWDTRTAITEPRMRKGVEFLTPERAAKARRPAAPRPNYTHPSVRIFA